MDRGLGLVGLFFFKFIKISLIQSQLIRINLNILLGVNPCINLVSGKKPKPTHHIEQLQNLSTQDMLNMHQAFIFIKKKLSMLTCNMHNKLSPEKKKKLKKKKRAVFFFAFGFDD